MVARSMLKLFSVGIGGAVGVIAYSHVKEPVQCAAKERHEYSHIPSVKWDSDWDKRHHSTRADAKESDVGDGDKKNLKPKAIRHLLLIRHGQYELDADSPEKRILTALGREQAELTGKRLKALNIPVNRIVISTMPRAQETGGIIAKNFPHVPPEQCDFIREGAPIPPEPSSSNWRPEAHFFQDGARIEAGFRKYFHRASPETSEDSYELLVCHANVIRYFVCRALQLPPEAWLRISLYNGSITWVTIRPNGRVSLRMLGDAGFMPKDKLTTN